MTDAPNWTDQLSSWSTFGQFVAVGAALIFAYRQLHSWRTPAIRQRKAETALSILQHADNLKEELLHARRLFDNPNEIEARYGRSDLYRDRLQEIRELEPLMAKLASDRIRQRYLIEDPVIDAVILYFIKAEEKLKSAMLYLSAVEGGNIYNLARNEGQAQNAWKVAIETDPDTDEFRLGLRMNFKNLEEKLRPIIDLK